MDEGLRGRGIIRIALVIAAASWLLAGCTSSGTQAGSPSTIVSGSPASPTPTLSGPCANDYFPVVEGARWTYVRDSDEKQTPLVQKFGAIGVDGFTVFLLLPGGGERDVWTCSPAGLTNVGQYATGSGGGPPPPGTVQFRQVRARGVSVPAAIDIGMEWKSVVTSEARFSLNGKRYLETQVITTEYRAMNEESVTVPAGTFDAIKVEMTSTTHKTEPDLGVNLTSVTSITQWWTRGIGMVRSEIDTGSGTLTEIVLRKHAIP